MAKRSLQWYIDMLDADLKARRNEIGRRIDKPTQGFAAMLWRSWENFNRQGIREAAALSYYALFSLFPLLLLLVVGIGQIIGPSTTGTQLNEFLKLFLPGPTATELSNTIERFVAQGATASIVASLSLAWSGLGLFSNLEIALSRTFGDAYQRPFLKRRAVGIVMIAALGILLIANLVVSLIFSVLDLLFLSSTSLWLTVASVFIPFGFSMAIFAMLYRWIPRTKVAWDAIWAAALLGATLWEGAKRLFSLYLNALPNLSFIYGSITAVIIFMIWTYFTCSILLLCAEFCVNLARWLEERKQNRRQRELHFAGDFYLRGLGLVGEKTSETGQSTSD